MTKRFGKMASPASNALPLTLLSCPCCASTGSQRYVFSKNNCNLFVCGQCGLGRAETIEFDPADYYNTKYFSGGHPDGYANYRGAEPILRREFARTVKYIRRYRASGRLLEIGCAYGFFLSEAKRFFQVVGIEPAADAAAYCRESGLSVLGVPVDEIDLSALGNMDVIVLLDVIEHLPNPAATLTRCVQHLNPGGLIVISTGDFGSIAARWLGRRWRLMTPPQHLWFFSAGSILRLAARLNLRVESLEHPWKIVPVSLISFQLQRLLGLTLSRSSGESQLGIPVNLFDAMRIVLRK
jgi:2-polyprenyl-3-methyl-5-hydroxy-6-metoxy-1,4-benzoquinol methylase